MSQGKDFTADLHSQMVAKEKLAGVEDQASCRPGKLLINKNFPNIIVQKTRGTILQSHFTRRSQELFGKDLERPMLKARAMGKKMQHQDKDGWVQARSLLTQREYNESTVGRTWYSRLLHGKCSVGYHHLHKKGCNGLQTRCRCCSNGAPETLWGCIGA